MAQDPHIHIINDADPHARRSQAISDLQRRVSALETSSPTLQVSPGGAPETSPRDGAQAISPAGPRLWIRISGDWRYAELH